MVFLELFKRFRFRSSQVNLIFVFFVFFLVFSQIGFGAQFGLEVELASSHLMEPDAAKIPDRMYVQPLAVVREAFRDSDSPIQIRPWTKDRRFREAIYLDPMGREWQVVPEYVNTPSFDGFELVTPPFQDQKDAPVLKKVLRKILGGGEYNKGIRSSVHVTVDVSHLFEVDGDASQLADTILFIENHWPEIYALISPTRYGTIINYYSVPLAVEQRDLLGELSQLVPAERTYARLRELFSKYEERERDLKGRSSREGAVYRSWKYRAANYKKLFHLGREKFLPVIEFRITDLEEPDSILAKAELFTRIIEKASFLEPNGRFKDSFGDVVSKRNLDSDRQIYRGYRELNRKLYRDGEKGLRKFLARLGLPSDSPAFKNLKGCLYLDEGPEKLASLLEHFDPSCAFFFAGQPVTFGFEMEMRGPRESFIVEKSNKRDAQGKLKQVVAKTWKYPFLVREADEEEDTRNIEVRSQPETKLDTLLAQMGLLKRVVGPDLRGFHLHIRVPLELSQRVPTEELNGWFSRISDAIQAWRLSQRGHFFALKAWSQVRLPPIRLEDRGTLRLRVIDQTLDIELRGFMEDLSMMRNYARKILVGFLRPEYIHGFEPQQSLLHFQEKNLVETIQQFVNQYERRQLTPAEITLLEDLDAHATKNGILPLYGFEHAPYLSPLEKIKIENANLTFQFQVVELLKTLINRDGNPVRKRSDASRQFRELIQVWGKSIDWFALCDQSILLPPSVESPERLLENAREMRAKLERAYGDPKNWRFIRMAARRLLASFDSERFPLGIAEPLEGEDPPTQDAERGVNPEAERVAIRERASEEGSMEKALE